MSRLLSQVATLLCKSQLLTVHSESRTVCNITKSLVQIQCYPITFLSMFYITCLIVIWGLCVPFINRSLYKSHKEFSKDKSLVLNIMHSLLNFNNSRNTTRCISEPFSIFPAVSTGLFSQVVPWLHFPSDTGSILRPFAEKSNHMGCTRACWVSRCWHWGWWFITRFVCAFKSGQRILNLYAVTPGKHASPTELRWLEISVQRSMSWVNSYSISKHCFTSIQRWGIGQYENQKEGDGGGHVRWSVPRQSLITPCQARVSRQSSVHRWQAQPGGHFSHSACCLFLPVLMSCLLSLLSWLSPLPHSLPLW